MKDTIKEARALLAAATPGPWVADGMIVYIDAGIQPHVCEALIRPSDADLIAAAPRLLAALADECELLRARVAVLEAAQAEYDAAMPTEEEIDDISEGIYADDRMTSGQLNRALHALSKVRDVRERLDAARKEGA